MRVQNSAWFMEKMLLAQVQEARFALSKEQLAILADTGDRVDSHLGAYKVTTNVIFQSNGIDLYNSDCDEVPTAQASFMANLSSYGSDVLPEANKEANSESLTAELERYKERVKTCEQRLNVDLSSREKLIDSQIDDMIRDRLALKQEIDSLKQTLSNQTKEKESLLQTFNVSKNESKEKESTDTGVISLPLMVHDVIGCQSFKELSVYVSDTYPNSPLKSEKLVTVTPMNKARKATFAKTISPTPYVSPSKKDYEILFQPLFDEYLNPPPCSVSPDPVVVTALRAVDPVGSPSLTIVDQYVSIASTSPTNQEFQSQVIHQGVEEQIHGHQNAQFNNAPLLHNLSSDLSSE
ncbi:hypothetical protein Tco_0140284 [Tanacetum coccineum]